MSLVDDATFKQVMRRWASGVTVLTSRAGSEIHGMTVSAFSSVSAEPPLVLVCANRSSTTRDVIDAGGVFAVNILSSDQEAISTRFAVVPGAERFDGVSWTEGNTGVPLIDGALAQLECRVRSAHLEGTHTIYIGEVLHGTVDGSKAPLLYFDGSYRRIDAD
ncbi:MAG: flavin reductase family protein [Myxococcota bacterium]